MNKYNYFSNLYDELTDEMDYTPWLDIVQKYNKGTILDVGCGSGTLLMYLNQLGFKCMGLDLSCDMLELARKKFIMNHLDIKLYEANMIDFKLDKVDTITCFFDTINHLSNDTEVLDSINNMFNHLNDGGYLIFDAFTKEKMEDIDNEEFVFDEATYHATWKMSSTNTNIIHNLEFKIGKDIIKEEYIETFFDIKKILSNFTITAEYPVVIDDVCERIIYVIKK